MSLDLFLSAGAELVGNEIFIDRVSMGSIASGSLVTTDAGEAWLTKNSTPEPAPAPKKGRKAAADATPDPAPDLSNLLDSNG